LLCYLTFLLAIFANLQFQFLLYWAQHNRQHHSCIYSLIYFLIPPIKHKIENDRQTWSQLYVRYMYETSLEWEWDSRILDLDPFPSIFNTFISFICFSITSRSRLCLYTLLCSMKIWNFMPIPRYNIYIYACRIKANFPPKMQKLYKVHTFAALSNGELISWIEAIPMLCKHFNFSWGIRALLC
jgi:hypothetical protein